MRKNNKRDEQDSYTRLQRDRKQIWKKYKVVTETMDGYKETVNTNNPVIWSCKDTTKCQTTTKRWETTVVILCLFQSAGLAPVLRVLGPWTCLRRGAHCVRGRISYFWSFRPRCWSCWYLLLSTVFLSTYIYSIFYQFFYRKNMSKGNVILTLGSHDDEPTAGQLHSAQHFSVFQLIVLKVFCFNGPATIMQLFQFTVTALTSTKLHKVSG